MTGAISASGLGKRFGSYVAVDGIDLEVRSGECFGLLGPNGAGKTSTIRMICCVSPVTAGELLVDGLDVRTHAREIKARLGVVPQDDNLDPDLTVEQNLRAYGRYFGLPRDVIAARIEEGLALFQLSDRRASRIDELSGGMKRRLVIARSLMNAPSILVLDEPTTGLDPQARQVVWQRLRLLKGRGLTMLLTTHYMEEAANLCDRLIIMDVGRIVAQGSPAELVAAHAGRDVLEVQADPEAHQALVADLERRGNFEVEPSGDTVYVFGRDGESPARLANEIAGDFRVTVRQANLEDVFLRLTGRLLKE